MPMMHLNARSEDQSKAKDDIIAPLPASIGEICEALIVSLDRLGASSLSIDEGTTAPLLQTKAAIEGVLNRSNAYPACCCRPSLTPDVLGSRPLHNPSLSPSVTTLSCPTTSIVGRVSGCSAGRVAPDKTDKRGSRAQASYPYVQSYVEGVYHLDSATVSREDGRKKSRQRAVSIVNGKRQGAEPLQFKKALFPTYPYTELSLKEGNDTVMAKILGDRASKWWRRRHNRNVELVGMWITSCLGWIIGFYLNFGPSETGQNSYVPAALLILYGISVSWLCTTFTSLMSWDLVKRCANVYETHLLMMEMFFCCTGYYILLGQSPLSASGAVGIFGGFCCIFLFYDSFSLIDRPRLRYVQLLNLLGFMVCLAFIYSELGDKYRLYQLDLAHGLAQQDIVGSHSSSSTDEDDSTKSKLTLSVKDFCLNRGCTIVYMAMKLVYSSFRHPDDCLIIKSRVRLTETPLDQTSEAVAAYVEQKSYGEYKASQDRRHKKSDEEKRTTPSADIKEQPGPS